VLEVAVNGQADAIVTFGRRDFLPASERFGMEILSPGGPGRRYGSVSRAGDTASLSVPKRSPKAGREGEDGPAKPCQWLPNNSPKPGQQEGVRPLLPPRACMMPLCMPLSHT
jgi:hypothetical protein